MTNVKIVKDGNRIKGQVTGHTDSRSCAFISGLVQTVLSYASEYGKINSYKIATGAVSFDIEISEDAFRMFRAGLLGMSVEENGVKVEFDGDF